MVVLLAVTVQDLAIALRLSVTGTDLDAAQTAVLTRLLGVGQAFSELLAEEAPTAIQDEAIIRFASYLYDQPLGRGQSYANAWVNSGAGSLVSRWVVRTIPGEVAQQ